MQYAQCKCGSHQVWHSGERIATCSPCKKCGTIPSGYPPHPEVTPHNFSDIETIRTDTGISTITRCSLCHRTKWEIEKDE